MLEVKNGPKTIPIRRLPTVSGSEKTNNELEKIGAKIKKHRGFRIRFWLP